MQSAELALLVVVIGVLVWRAVTRERREYSRFKRLRTTAARQKVYRRWLIEALLLFGGLSAAVLLAAWNDVPVALDAARASAPLGGLLEVLGRPLLGGALLLLVAVALVLPVLLLRGKVDEVPAVGDVQALLPRTRGELRWGAALSVNAGVMEELLFRLALPALLFAVLGNAIAAFGIAAVLFGLLHVYQGWVGVLVTFVLGLLFTVIYLAGGSIVWPILLHALVDLRSFVLIPVAVHGVWAKR